VLDQYRLYLRILADFDYKVQMNDPPGGVVMTNPGKKNMEPRERKRLASHDHTKMSSEQKIVKNAEGIISIHANETLGTVLVIGGLKHKSDVKSQNLTHCSSSKPGSVTSC
jgi:hypothetical protein